MISLTIWPLTESSQECFVDTKERNDEDRPCWVPFEGEEAMKRNMLRFLIWLLALCSACGQSSAVPVGVTVKEATYAVDNLGQPCIQILCEQKDGFGDLTKDGVDASGVKLAKARLLRKTGNDWEPVTQFFDELNNDLSENQGTTVYLYPKQLGDHGFEPLFLEEGAQYRLQLVLEVSYVTLSSFAPPLSDEYPLPTLSIQFV